jgi:hypothetical protein
MALMTCTIEHLMMSRMISYMRLHSLNMLKICGIAHVDIFNQVGANSFLEINLHVNPYKTGREKI